MLSAEYILSTQKQPADNFLKKISNSYWTVGFCKSPTTHMAPQLFILKKTIKTQTKSSFLVPLSLLVNISSDTLQITRG